MSTVEGYKPDLNKASVPLDSGSVPQRGTSRANGAGQNLTMTGTSQQAAVAAAGTHSVRLATAAQPAFYEIGSNPTAAATSFFLPANAVEVVQCAAGERVAVLQGGTAGTISVRYLS